MHIELKYTYFLYVSHTIKEENGTGADEAGGEGRLCLKFLVVKSK